MLLIFSCNYVKGFHFQMFWMSSPNNHLSVKVISQETFDWFVKENMEAFGMEMAEAIADAKEQFEKQGINLLNIVTSEKCSQVVVESGLESSCH